MGILARSYLGYCQQSGQKRLEWHVHVPIPWQLFQQESRVPLITVKADVAARLPRLGIVCPRRRVGPIGFDAQEKPDAGYGATSDNLYFEWAGQPVQPAEHRSQ
eukprot:3629875-Amphidinium_carterae.1